MKIILIDLDGTLTDTAHERFTPFKDGLQETNLDEIPLIPGAREFINNIQIQGHLPIIASDSHPRYVKKIAEDIFNIEYISLCDKPNFGKVKDYLNTRRVNFPEQPDIETDKDNFIVVGDTWLDIEFGRALNVSTILTTLYIATGQEQRDGIGQGWKHLKSGATYYASTFNEISEIINNPLQNLLAVEGIFQGVNSTKSVKLKTTVNQDRFIAYRTLGRQQSGECDKYSVASKYFEFQRVNRTQETLLKLAQATSNFIASVQASMPTATWDYFTYVSDKATTIPPNKLRELFELVETPITKIKLILWATEIEGNIRTQPNYQRRIEFVDRFIFIDPEIDLQNKSIIMIDDQFTTGATANSICGKLIDAGVKNILFVTLFNLINKVESERVCPNCGTRLQVKVNRQNGNRFLSCVAPRYGGTGCGNFIANII